MATEFRRETESHCELFFPVKLCGFFHLEDKGAKVFIREFVISNL